MTELYASALQVSPRKKRCPPELDDENTLSPKKLRTAQITSLEKSSTSLPKRPLPAALSRLYDIYSALQQALSHALATCAISPTSDSGRVRNVLNHISLLTYTGISSSFEVDDLKRLCWLWEWEGDNLNSEMLLKTTEDSDVNPFLDTSTSTPAPTDWTRGGMGIIISPATYFSKADRKRMSAYGIGIEVEMDIDKEMRAGIAAIARWTASAAKRRSDFLERLERWMKLHDGEYVPSVPLADIPELSTHKISSLTRTLATFSPSAASPSKSPASSSPISPTKKLANQFSISSLSTPKFPKSSPNKSSILFPQTPKRNTTTMTDRLPSSAIPSPIEYSSVPSTPVRQKGSDNTPNRTPSTSRRQAVLERVRQRSLSLSPVKGGTGQKANAMTRDQLLKMSQDEMRRRCLLGRLSGVAESIWMLFSSPAASGASLNSPRKRRALPFSDVITAVVKSSPVPISTAEANESVAMLLKMCPFFLKKLDFDGEHWLEMPTVSSNITNLDEIGPMKNKLAVSSSPGRVKGKDDSAQELVTRSPRRLKRDGGVLREVREIIRREMDFQD